MTSEPRAFLTLEIGGATLSTALIGHLGGRWRLLGSLSLPSGADPDAASALLVRRARTANADLATATGLDRLPLADLPRLEVRSHRPRRLAVVAGSERALEPLVAAAARSGWVTTSASAESADPLEMTALLLDAEVDAILAGAGDPPAADERRALGELGALVEAAAHRRPDVPVILAGSMAAQVAGAATDGHARPGMIVSGPAARPGPDGQALRELLLEASLPLDDARRAHRAAAASLAEVLDRRVDVVDIGYDAGTRVSAWRDQSGAPEGDLAVVPSAALAPDEPDDEVVDRVTTWSTWTADRHRVRDRLRELRIAPWSDAAAEGIGLRQAALRAALASLARWTPEWAQRPAADLVVLTGGAWAAATPPAMALALVDVLRRAGASQVAHDHARLLGALGSIPDARERRTILADLAEDLLAPIGTVVVPGGVRQARNAATLELHGRNGHASRAAQGHRELRAGGVHLVDLPPGSSAVAEFRFHDAVRLGGRGRHVALEVTGGLGGLLIDLRDVPLRLPDRADLRAELLESWQAAVRPGSQS